jgi:hypothetical protein
VVGDWNGNGRDTVGVRRGDRWLLRNALTAGFADVAFNHASHPAAVGITGDYNGNGQDTVGYLLDTQWILRNTNSDGPPSLTYRFAG